MILRGILDRSLGSIVCVRGFAQLQDLERVSAPNNSYQRDIIPSHQKDILQFLETSDYKYFPELTLSYTLNPENDNAVLSSARGEVLDIIAKKKNKIAFSKSITKYTGQLDSRNKDKVEIVAINIDETLLTEGTRPFHRIDGNHRLSAALEVKELETKRMPTPFCLILLSGDVEGEKFESVIFHNINSKGERLTSEENLKAILNERFSDDELIKNFSWSYVKARQLAKKLDFTYLDAIQNAFKNPLNTSELHIRTVSVKALEFLKGKKLITKGVSISKVIEHLTTINSFYKDEPLLKSSTDECLLIAFLYYAFKENGSTSHLVAFRNWIVSNKIYKIRITETESIIEIFDKLLEKEIRVFMAMPYYNDRAVDKYNTILQSAIDEIKKGNSHLNLSKYPIMREEGPSMDIVNNILNNIRNCEILVVDITDNKQNVFFEYGFGHSLNKKIILVKKTEDTSIVPFDVEHNSRLKYKDLKALEKLLIQRIKQTIVQLGYVLNK